MNGKALALLRNLHLVCGGVSPLKRVSCVFDSVVNIFTHTYAYLYLFKASYSLPQHSEGEPANLA